MELCTKDGCKIRYHKLPMNCEHKREELFKYLENGIKPGRFIYCLLTNDLRGAIQIADDDCLESICELVEFVIREIPQAACGRKDIVDRWISDNGAKGRYGDKFIKLEVK